MALGTNRRTAVRQVIPKQRGVSQCCNTEMITTMELGRFVEMRCTKCGDLVYMKHYSEQYRNEILEAQAA